MRVLDACYDLAHAPPTFDFISFLLVAEGTRIELGCDKIAFHILPGPVDGFRRDTLPPFSVDERRQMRDEIVVPATKLLPSCASCVVEQDRNVLGHDVFGFGSSPYGFGEMIKAARRGLFPLRAPREAPRLAMRNYVTITLREADYWPTRNSNVPEWIEVAKALQKRGFCPVIVRDTGRAHELVDGLPNSPQASQDLIFRAALYEHAEMNFFVNNGPGWMCLFLGAPCLMVKMTSPDAPVVSDGFFTSHGFPPGSAWPNARPRQHIAWVNDNRTEILAEFDKVMECSLAG